MLRKMDTAGPFSAYCTREEIYAIDEAKDPLCAQNICL